MVKKQLEKYLFRQNYFTYTVLDGASVPDLPVKLHEMKARNICLYRGELEPDIVYVAPYLVHLIPETEFTNWLLAECWGKHWGIFAQTPISLTGMRKHFRSLLTVYDETGNPLLFRFYDPRVFLKYLPTCTTEEVETFFGTVNYYFAEVEDATELRRYNFEDDKLKKVNLEIESKDKK
jgi:hypothetical protein